MTSTSSPFSFGESSSLSNNNACYGREESTRHDTMYYEIVATGYVFLWDTIHTLTITKNVQIFIRKRTSQILDKVLNVNECSI